MIKEISFKEYVSSMRDLFKDHWEEIASNKGKRNLHINENLFITIEEMGQLLTLGVFIENKLVGYSVNFLTIDTHDCTKKLCCNDAIYIDKKYRKGSLGLKLIKEVEKKAKERGCYATICHSKPNTSLDKLLERIDYTIKDFLYMKEL